MIKYRNEFFTVDDSRTYKRVTAKLHAQGIVLRDEIEGSQLKTKKQQLCKAGDFLVAEIDAKVGGFGVVPPELEGAIVSSHYFLFEINEEKLDKMYLGYFAKTPHFQKQINARGSTNYASIRPNQILDLEIRLPPLDEQKRIVAKIDSYVAGVKETQSLRMNAKEQADELMDSALQSLDLTGFEVVSREIRECSSMKTGKTPPTHVSEYYGDDIEWYCPSDLEYAGKGWLNRSRKRISYFAVNDGKATIYEKGTVLLVAIGGSIGKVAITKEKCSSNQQITGIKFNEEIEPMYGYYWIRRLFSEITRTASQTTLPIINQRRIGSLGIKYPKDLQIQHRIIAHLDSLQEKVNELKKLQDETEEEIEELVPTTLDKAFMGEL